MSWSRPLALAAALASTLALGGCFQPLYGGAGGQDLRASMAAIEVDPIPDRIGHYLRGELVFDLDGSGTASPKRYRLSVKVEEKLSSPIVDTATGRAQTGNITTQATYKLKIIETDSVIAEGVAVAAVSYDRSTQRFAALRAARDAEIRTASDLAEQIKTRLIAVLANRR